MKYVESHTHARSGSNGYGRNRGQLLSAAGPVIHEVAEGGRVDEKFLL